MPRNTSSRTASKTPSRAPARGASKKAEKTVLHMLAEDHKKVKKMFDQFEKIKDDDDAKQMLIEKCCAELTVHAQLEEELFYPALRDTIEDLDLIDEAEVEHATAKQLISELSSMQPGDALYEAKFTVLGEYVKHHIEEEEKEIFAKAKKSGLDLEAMAEEAKERKAELREELGLDLQDQEEEGPELAQEKPARRRNVH